MVNGGGIWRTFAPHTCIFKNDFCATELSARHPQLSPPRPISISCTYVCGAGSRCSQSPHLWVLGSPRCHLILLMKALLRERSGCKKKKVFSPSLPIKMCKLNRGGWLSSLALTHHGMWKSSSNSCVYEEERSELGMQEAQSLLLSLICCCFSYHIHLLPHVLCMSIAGPLIVCPHFCPNPSPLCHYASNQQFEWKKGLRGPRIAEDSTISTANTAMDWQGVHL